MYKLEFGEELPPYPYLQKKNKNQKNKQKRDSKAWIEHV